MGIVLKNELRAQLYTQLCSFLRTVRTSENLFLDFDRDSGALANADACLPDKGPLRDMLVRYIHEFPIREFVTDYISADLMDKGEYEESASEPLTKTEGYEDIHEAAERILVELESLPWNYTITLKLPEVFAANLSVDKRLVIDDYMSIEFGERLEPEFPLAQASEIERGRIAFNFDEGLTGEWEDGVAYLQVKTEGFIGPYSGNSPEIAAIDDMKSFMGLLLSINSIRVNQFWSSPAQQSYVYVHREIKGKQTLISALEVPQGMSLVLQKLESGDLKDSTASDDRRQKIFLQTIQTLSIVFRERPATDNIRAAARWLFNSYGSQDELLQYIQTMVVIEILLGSQKYASELSIGDTISNRCAYMIGKDWKERQSILDDFKEIYAVRSQIVHRGKSRLNHVERGMLGRLQELARKVIMEEVLRMPKTNA